MGWFGGIVVYVIIWWMVLFCVLPIGVHPAGEGDPGHETGAPANPRLGMKLAVTTAISAVLFLVVDLVVLSGWISLGGR